MDTDNTLELLVAGLKLLGLKLEEVEAVMSWLRTEDQRWEMMDWIADNYKREPGKVEIVETAYNIMEEI